jgi:putative ABC transport system permease protein
LPGVRKTTVLAFIPGYVEEPKNRTFVVTADAAMAQVFPDWGISQELWNRVQHDRSGIVMSQMQAQRWHKKVGDTFTIISPQIARADGAKAWTFKVLAVTEDKPTAPAGFNMGNYDYFDKSRPPSDQGKINEVDLVTDDPARSVEIAQQIDQIFANSSTPTETQTEKAAYAVGNNFGGLDVDALTRDIALAGLGMIVFLTANVISQSVRERFAEFATLRALGYSDAVLVSLVVLEAAVPCVAGAGFGVALAGWLAVQIPALMPPGFGLPKPTMSATVYMWAAISAFVMAFASAVLPTVRLMRMDIATALSGRT